MNNNPFPKRTDFVHLPAEERENAYNLAVVAWAEADNKAAMDTPRASTVLAEAPASIWPGDAPTPDPQPAPALAAIQPPPEPSPLEPTTATQAPIAAATATSEYAEPIANDKGAVPETIGGFFEPELAGSVEEDGTVTPAGVEPPSPAKPRMPFRGNSQYTRELARDSAAGSIVIHGVEYIYREMHSALKAWAEARPQWMADQLGIPLQNYLEGKYFNIVPDPAEPNNAEKARIVFADPEKVNLIPQWIEESHNVIMLGFVQGEKPIPGCLVDWAVNDVPLGVPICRVTVEDMFLEVKAAITLQVQRSMKFGMPFSQFRA